MWNRNYDSHLQRQNDLIREAERERLARFAVRAGRPRSSIRVVRPAVMWFGRQLVAWGSSLQQYAVEPVQREAY
jgi:hypothetical protein